MSEEKTLVEDLMDWRAERPDEWVMDRFIRKARELQGRLIQAEITAKRVEHRTGEERKWGKQK